MTLALLLLSTVIVFACLILERARLDRRRRAIALVIAVTGTRGKSSVARMLASVLRESGRRVLAKTTGSEPALVLPDGSVKQVRRGAHPSIIEQKHLIHLGAELGVDAAVVEIMSIHPENHLVETHYLLKPHLVLVTNLRVDHTAAMGNTRDEVASVIGLDIPEGARVFVPRQECLPSFRTTVAERGAELIEVPPEAGSESVELESEPGISEFSENIDLVCAAARSLGVADGTIWKGIRRTRRDIGALRIWRYRPAGSQAPCLAVNAFAANDPESTMLVYGKVMTALGADPERCVGLMNLRPDRGDRTLQWVDALSQGVLQRFSRLYVFGLHAPALKRRLRRLDGAARIEVLRRSRPVEMMRTVASGIRDSGGVVFGFGNIGGVGQALAAHWSEVGEPLEV
ncbi:MAG: poly-gamma-glutamate synthase PgsB [Gemmatimonadales bacterium]|nr:poly-gamma-glutamate synthase PgsB [Gemmatimonadales bacterium]NIN13202.1 poly-gamma-glutamate synthase PgsB [Gemmatimonadales bacterium]NIN51480.1 poly-gamma-glutamate synthase PgsB [Gemmatimonadales bacterium]NIP08944.1 poly-gamma-glutamate synthase PgsB [Gemmatimonadales bacterium]NIR03732.1 poly-gamma-glutamate synthase PgsB [Gemmatimonadales bacterium]